MHRALRIFSAVALLSCGDSEPQGTQSPEPLPEAGIVITPSTELTTTDRGGSAQFTVALKSAPATNVRFAVRTSNPGAGLPSPAMLTFSPDTFGTPQTVTVTGVKDRQALGDLAYQILLDPAQSSDSRYSGLRPSPIAIVHRDSDHASVIVNLGGNETSDTGGTASFNLVLESQPLADVAVKIELSPTTYAALSAPTLTFTPDSWDKPQTVTLTGLYGPLIEGSKPYFLSFVITGDTAYAGLQPPGIQFTHKDFAPRHCKQLKTAVPTLQDGAYEIDPDGAGPMGPTPVYCDMSRDDGGWTLVARISDGSTGAHRTADAVGSVTDPKQTTTAKLSDALINLLREDYAASILRIEAADGKIDYFREDKAFVSLGYTGSMNLVYDTYTAAMAQNGGCRGVYNGTYHTGLVGWTCYDSFLYADNPGFRALNYQAGAVWVK